MVERLQELEKKLADAERFFVPMFDARCLKNTLLVQRLEAEATLVWTKGKLVANFYGVNRDMLLQS